MKILVLSCDKNKDLFYPFYYCMEKYWPNHPEVIYSTESISNSFYKTISFNYDIEHWTDRIRNTLQQIDDKYVLVMVDDIFLQANVDDCKVKSLIDYFDNNTACINLEPSFDNDDEIYKNDILKRNIKGNYKISLMCGLWNRDKLIELLDYSTNPWRFEWNNKHKDFTYLITTKGDYLNWGYKTDKEHKKWRFGLHKGKWFRECIKFFNEEGIEMDFSKRGCLNLNKCFGIISYFTWDQPERKQRQDRLDRLVKRLSDLWPDIPIMIIAQQWKYYKLDGKCENKVIRFDYGKLGILGARHALRKHFLESEFDYIIMLDDDALFELDNSNVAKEYMNEIDKHPNGFCFLQYTNSQLNLCAISKYIYEKEPIPNIDPQKSEAFEDKIWAVLLHNKYPESEFLAPKGIRCVHFKNPAEVVPSTWASQQQYNWKQMRANTLEIVNYISEHKELPDKWKK